jgi:hypothetical protein
MDSGVRFDQQRDDESHVQHEHLQGMIPRHIHALSSTQSTYRTLFHTEQKSEHLLLMCKLDTTFGLFFSQSFTIHSVSAFVDG